MHKSAFLCRYITARNGHFMSLLGPIAKQGRDRPGARDFWLTWWALPELPIGSPASCYPEARIGKLASPCTANLSTWQARHGIQALGVDFVPELEPE